MGELYEKEEGNGGTEGLTGPLPDDPSRCVAFSRRRPALSQERERADMDMMLSRNNGVQATTKLAEAGAKVEQAAKL